MSLSVEDILVKQSILFKSAGRDYLIKCLNPEHDDSNPSLRVDKLSGKMHCFSCGFKGNIFEHFAVTRDLRDARVVELLRKVRSIRKGTELEIPLGAQPFREEMYRNISNETYNKFGAFTHLEQFPERVVFPLKDIGGKIVGFQGRYIWSKESPKYIIHPRDLTPPLFPAFVKPYEGSIILVEGIFDFLNLYDKGLTNAVAALGITTLLKNWREKLLPLKLVGTHTIHILFDEDTEKHSEKLASRIENEFIVNIIDIKKYQRQNGEDPGDFSSSQVRKLKGDLYENSSNNREGPQK